MDAKCDLITIPVNCVGVMGAGLAKQFKSRHHDSFLRYKEKCDRGVIKPGYLYIDDTGGFLFFPTKRHWKSYSRFTDIMKGIESLQYLLEDDVFKHRYQSIAMPKVGCGLGGLEWSDVRPLFNRFAGFRQEIWLYE